MRGFLETSLQGVLRSSDFFTFFHLIEFPQESDKEKNILVFRPSGESFQKFAKVKITLGAKQEIRAISLTLTRSFVDNPRQGIFAADIAKSFLRGALTPPGSAQVQDLADDIEFRISASAPVLTAMPGRGAQTLERAESAAFGAYRGRSQRVEISSNRQVLVVENMEMGGEDVLVMAASADA